jgi:hypothetical protein
VYVYLAAAHQNGSTEALELAHQLSSWHDQMVMHARVVAREGTAARCHESCPHARAIDLWRIAREILGDAAHQFGFLKAAAAAVKGESTCDI